MPLTEEQFKEFMQAMGSRDLLIRIDENTKNHRQLFDAHTQQDTVEFSKLEQSTNAVHERLDAEIEQRKRVRWIALGAVLVLNIVFFMIVNGSRINNAYRAVTEPQHVAGDRSGS